MSDDPTPDDPRTRAAAEARARLRAGGDDGRSPSDRRPPEPDPRRAPAPAEPPPAPLPDEGAPGLPAGGAPAADAAAVGGPVAGGAPAADPLGGRVRRRWPTVALAVACVALAVGLVVSLVALSGADGRAGRARTEASARASALKAATSYAIDLSTYDYKDLSASSKEVLAHSTASFRKSYTGSSSALNTVLEHYKASAVGKVLAAGISSATPKQVVVLLFLDQTTRNTQHKSATTDESRLEMTLVRHGSQWLIDKVLVV